jgi:Beta-propeller repeat
MKIVLPFFLLLFWGVDNAFSQTFNWSRQLSNINWSNSVNAVSVDSARNSYVTGSFVGTVTFPAPCPTLTSGLGVNGPSPDIFVAKFDSSGGCQWVNHYPAVGDHDGNGISVDRGDVYVTGHFIGNVTFGAYTLHGHGKGDIFIAKLNQNGVVQWAVRGGGPGFDIAYSIASRGKPYVTGYVSNPGSGSVTFDSTAGPPCTLTGVGPSRDIFVVGYSSTGVCLVSKRAGGGTHDAGNGVSVDGTGNVYVTGVSSGKAFVAKWDSTLNQIWWKTINGNSTGYGISTDSQGNSYVAGQFSGTVLNPFSLTSIGPSDAFVAMFEPTLGTAVWVRNISGPGSNVARSISVRESCDLYVTGSFTGSANFGNSTSLTSNGGSDIFVAHYYVDGGIQWVVQAGGSLDEEGRGISADNFGKASVVGVYKSNPAVFMGASPSLTTPNNLQNIFFAKASP